MENSHTKQAPPKSLSVAQDRSKIYPPNPFEQVGLWGREELLRQIFEQLGRKSGAHWSCGLWEVEDFTDDR